MPSNPREPSRRVGWLGLAALVLVAVGTLVFAARAALTRSTIHLALVEYALALWLMVGLKAEDWRVVTPRGQLVRWLWTWACVTFLVHVGCAFHITHHWSHAHAFEQTRVESGFGEGLYVNYLFMALWTADVLWWWIAPENYALRTSWIDRVFHVFLLFIAFNATVVFERGAVRYAGAIASLILVMRWFQRSDHQRITRSDDDRPADPRA